MKHLILLKNLLRKMTTKILDGKALSEKLLKEAKEKVSKMKTKPKLVVIQVGENAASKIYVRKKKEACEKVGVDYEEILFPETTTQKVVLNKIEDLNNDEMVSGIIVQLPIPDNISVPLVIRAIDPKKDVDGFCAYNLGKVFLSKDFEHLPPATPLGIIKILEEYNIDPKGMNAVVVGHSNIVGKPISMMLLNRDATVTTCHIHTKNLKEHTKNADLLVVAVGKINLITADMIKDGAIVIDVGMNRNPKTGKLCGDVDFENLSKKTSYITPVPGGVGPMTVACLVLNTIHARERQEK